MMRYTTAVDAAGDAVAGYAKEIETLGADMFQRVRDLIGSGGLTGRIAEALEQAQTEWDTGVQQFSAAEHQLAMKTKDSYSAIMAADNSGAGYF